MRALLARDRNVHTHARYPAADCARTRSCDEHLRQAHKQKGAVVVMDAASGDVLAMVSAPAPEPPARTAAPTPDELLDRARYGQYPPGSTFKLVTAMAALRLDPELKHRTFLCRTLPRRPRGRVMAGWNRAHQRRYQRPRARHARHGTRHRGFLQRLLRAAGRT